MKTYSIRLSVESDRDGCDPDAVSSLGAMARKISAGHEAEEERDEYEASQKTDDQEKRRPGLGAMARRYRKGRGRDRAEDALDIGKIDLSNFYDDPETVGNPTR